MKITLLGTGTSQGIPQIACDCTVCMSENPKDNRLRSSIMIEVDNQTLVVDTGPDFRTQMLREKVQKVDAILFTHEHKDHIAGLDDVRAFNHKWKTDMEVFSTERVEQALKREFHYVFSGCDYPGIPKININIISDQPFYINKTEIIPIEVMHHKLSVLGFRINNFAYITDLSFISETEKEKLKNLDVLVLDSLRKKEHVSHFNLEQSLSLINELNPKKSYLTHISHLMGREEDVSKELPENVQLAFDGQKIVMKE
jgi:phosphoribosyl 1,2-cyclic phosphate phosphodiesterase